MSFLNELNDRQREAAETLLGPLLIVAGAGSGKTRALTYRIANLIAEGVAKPWEILAVTFTNKAAGEMRERTEALIEKTFGRFDPDNQPMIGTFHSICVRILRRNFDKFGREKSFVIYDTVDQESVMKRLIKERQIDDEKIKPRVVLSKISNAKNKLQTADMFKSRVAPRVFDQLVADLYVDYEKRLIANNALDFDDLLLYTVRLFREYPDVLNYYQERWRFINVDEYQDTNHAQYTLTRLLASKYRNLCVIGDSDQSIYGFRGADIQNILTFEKDYPEAKLIKLEQNYRSTQVILDAADSIIEKNKQRKSKKMWTEQKGGDMVEVWHLENEQAEVQKVAQEIESLIGDGTLLRDIVILYRTNAQSRTLEEMLLRYGLPYKVIGGVKFYARKEIKDILAYLRVVLNPNDTDSLLRIINVPSRKIGQTTVNKLQAFAMTRSLTLGEVLKHVEMISEINTGTKSRLAQFWNLMEKWRISGQKMVVSSLIREIVDDINFKGYLLDGTEEGEMRHENTLELISVATKYDGLEPELSLASFLEEVALIADVDNLNQNDNVLTMMTLHSVKGLEYPYVFIIGCEENIFPHSRAMFNPDELEEERRLMYVGVTRAMKKLYLVAAKQRMLYGDYQRNTLSRFVHDIPEHLTSRVGVESSSDDVIESDYFGSVPTEKAPIRLTAEQKFKDGDKVRHGTFGEGLVVERRGDLVTIAFSNPLFGIKKFAATVAPLEKVE